MQCMYWTIIQKYNKENLKVVNEYNDKLEMWRRIWIEILKNIRKRLK